VAGRHPPGAAEQNVGIFSLPGFVVDRGQICFLGGSLPLFFLHVRDPSGEAVLNATWLRKGIF
jgi:hypothetical protein